MLVFHAGGCTLNSAGLSLRLSLTDPCSVVGLQSTPSCAILAVQPQRPVTRSAVRRLPLHKSIPAPKRSAVPGLHVPVCSPFCEPVVDVARLRIHALLPSNFHPSLRNV